MPQNPLTLDDKGNPPVSRIPTATQCRELFWTCYSADEKSAQNRNACQKQIDGHRPFNGAELSRLGLGSTSNLNFGEAQADMDRAIAAYNDMLTSQERIAFVALRSDYSSASMRMDYANKIAIAFHRVNVEWDEYYYENQMVAFWFNKDGIGVYIYPNERDPRWRAESLDGFKIPRGVKAVETKVPYAFARHFMQAHELWAAIKDPKKAKKNGWDVEGAKKAIQAAYSKRETGHVTWSTIETRLKNNDLYATSAHCEEIRAWDCFVREFDGKYSHHIFLEDGGEDYLFTKVGRYPNATSAFIISAYGIGTNGCYHGIRGLAYRIFPFVEHSNRLRNKMLDGAMASCSLMFEAADASAAQKMGIAYLGPYAILPTGLKAVTATLPNPTTGALPIMEDLAATRVANTGGFITGTAAGGAERRELDIQREMANQAVLPATSVNLFMIARTKMMTEQLRRLSLRGWGPNEGGSQMAAKFKQYLTELEVPLEALDHIASISAARALGAGSPAARQLAYQKLSELMPELDEVGRNNLIRDMIGSEVGFDQVDRYAPQLSSRQRPVIDEKIAELENSALMMGNQVQILENEDHAIHLKVHLKALVMAAHVAQTGQNIMATLQFLQVGLPHAQQHATALAQDPTRNGILEGAKPVLASLSKLGNQLAIAVQRAQAGGGAAAPSGAPAPGAGGGAAPAAGGPAPGGQGGMQISAVDQAKIQAVQAQIQIAASLAQATIQRKQQESLQRMQIRDADNAQKIRLRDSQQLAAADNGAQ